MRAVEIWRKQRAERGVIMPRYYSFRGEEIAKTKGKTFFVLADLRNEKQIESCFLLCFAGEEQSYIWY